MFSKIFPKIHAEGYKFLVIAGIITILFYTFSDFLGLIGLVLTIWVYYFFRDPERVIIDDDNYLVSPADGEVIKVEEVELQAMYTPGHTDCSYSFLMNDRVFTGDTLLINGSGRTDFQNGIRKL